MSRRFAVTASIALAACALVGFMATSPASASGGTPVGVWDQPGADVFDGFCTGYTSDGTTQEYVTRFDAGTLDPTIVGTPVSTIVCGAHIWVYNFDGALTFHGGCFIRPEDPANPGYPDLATTLASAEEGGTAGTYPPGYSDSRATFGPGGSGVSVDGTATTFLCWQHPTDQGSGVFAVCPMLRDTYEGGASNDSVVVSGGTFGYLVDADFEQDMTVFQTSPLNARLSMHGSQRFPGDKGISIVYSQRPNSGTAASDDKVSYTAIIDNNTGGPFSANIRLEADKANAIPKLGAGFKNITSFFAPKITNPVVFPTGRTVLNGSLRAPIKPTFYKLMPIELPVRLTVERSSDSGVADTETDTVGLRNYAGQYDADTSEVAFLIHNPTLPGDIMAVQFQALDLPKTRDYVISGASVVGSEFGGTGLAGFDYVELRGEDAILTAPDDSPSGLLRIVGTNDGVGEISAGGGGPASEAVVDFVPNLAVPVTDPTFTSINYWIKVGLTPGDGFSLGTAIVMDNQASTRQETSYFVDGSGAGGYTRVDFFRTQNYNTEVRLQLDGQKGTLPERQTGSGKTPRTILTPDAIPSAFDWTEHVGR
jgi:hypothetical protein